ncbi:MAG: S41 family peptidase [Anaerolineales bacterium]|jgi:carboxyl-terminal processing protease
MSKKILLLFVGGIISLVLLTAACSAGFIAGQTLSPTSTISPTAILEGVRELQTPSQEAVLPPTSDPGTAAPTVSNTGTPADVEELFKPFWEAWDILHQSFVDQPLDDEALMQGAIKGMLESLGDEHTSYMNPDQFRQANIPLEGEYEGIGAWVDPDAEFLTIVSPMPGSPAEQVGLKPGDQIIAVDGEDMTGVDGNLVIRQVLGPAGSNVTLTIRREGQAEPFDVEITRAKITIPSVDARMLDHNIAYVQLITFGDTSTQDLHNALQDMLAQNPDGLILDLRNNGGGYLNTAVDVASEFIKDGVVLYEQYGDGSRDTFYANGHGIATDIPLVVLVNEGTASASEIVAGAIQDYGRGKLVGTTTFGKGSVQTWVPLTNDEGAVRVTIARWLTPNERQIHQIGLQPDVVVELPTPADGTDTGTQTPEDVQLQAAIDLLTQQ